MIDDVIIRAMTGVIWREMKKTKKLKSVGPLSVINLKKKHSTGKNYKELVGDQSTLMPPPLSATF